MIDKLKNLKGEIKIKHFLPYTPELNVIETQWSVMRNAAGNRVYSDTDEIEKSIREMIRKDEITPVKMNDFLTC